MRQQAALPFNKKKKKKKNRVEPGTNGTILENDNAVSDISLFTISTGYPTNNLHILLIIYISY